MSGATRAATADHAAPGHAVPGRAAPSPTPGASLRLSEPSDPLEREADHMADRVMRLNAGTVMRACSCSDEEVKRKADGPSGASRQVASGPVARSEVTPLGAGRPLGAGVQSWADSAFGADMSAVRVHTASAAADVAASINARAYTIGTDIVFGRDQYRPDSAGGRRLLAHELTHVVQSTTGRSVLARDLAIAPTNPGAVIVELSDEEVESAISYNRRRFTREVEISQIRDVIGVPPEPAVIDESFVRALARYQADFGLAQDGKLGAVTAANLSREMRAEARSLGRDGRELRREARRLDRRSFTIAVTQAAHELTNTGSAEYAVQWAVPDPSANGWIIQHVTFSAEKRDCTGNVVAANNGPLEFWEGWEVRGGRVFIGSTANAHVADTFRTVDEGAGTRGTARIIGRVTFIPNFDLRIPPWGHAVAAAGALPTIQVRPRGWTDGFARRHEMVVTWDDCAAPATHSVTTTP